MLAEGDGQGLAWPIVEAVVDPDIDPFMSVGAALEAQGLGDTAGAVSSARAEDWNRPLKATHAPASNSVVNHRCIGR